jgi:hypothetical protein
VPAGAYPRLRPVGRFACSPREAGRFRFSRTSRNPPRTLNLVAARLRPQGPDTLIVSGEFEVGDSLSARARHSDTLYRRPWTKGTYLTEIPGAHRDMPVVVPWDVHWEGSTLVVSSESGELLGMSGPFRFGPE